MKPILVLLCVFLLSSCAITHQYMTLSSPEVDLHGEEGLVWENDTLAVTYRFDGLDGPVRLAIRNKTDFPIEINWRKSALIVNGEATPYYSPNMRFNGSGVIDTIRPLFSRVAYNADFNGSIIIQ